MSRHAANHQLHIRDDWPFSKDFGKKFRKKQIYKKTITILPAWQI